MPSSLSFAPLLGAVRARLQGALGFVILLVLALLLPTHAHAQQFPFGVQHQGYRAGTLFPTNYSRTQLNQHVADYYDVWKGRWLAADAASGGWRVKSDSSGRTVSEGQGYGMVIVAAMAGHDPQAKTIFDGLWKFRLAHPSTIDNRLMDWEVPNTDGNDSAFDGDADIAYGLLMAHAQWGSDGTIDYLAAARNVIAGIRASTIGPQSRLPMLGDWVSPNGSTYSQWTTRSSDFMPGHFRAYGSATGDPAFWNSVVTATQNVVTDIQSNESANTGLLPDFIKLVGASRDPQPAPNLLEGANDGNYWYNAGRDPWRLGVDAILNNDPVTLAQVQKISNWARTSTGGDPNKVRGGYKLDGAALNSWQDIFFIAPMAVAAMTGEGAVDQQWLNSLYNRVYQSHNTSDYYGDAVTLQSLLAVTGNFWDPTAVLRTTTPGDFDHDGDVDGDDLGHWKTNFGVGNQADANGDGVTDGADFLVWQRNYHSTTNVFLSVPEPSTTAVTLSALSVIGASLTLHRRANSRTR
jgi:endoglucanase